MPQFNLDTVGRWIFFAGIGLATVGLLIWLSTKAPWLSKLGNLPGDIRYTSPDGSFGCYAPIVTLIVISLVLTILLNIVVRVINK